MLVMGAIGTYNIVAIFSRQNSWDIAAKIGSAPTPGDIFTTSNALNANQTAGVDAIEFDGSYAIGRGSNAGAAQLGQITTTVVGQQVAIYINGLESNTVAGFSVDERTLYAGIGYAMIPEPSAALLGGLGMLALLRRRR